MAECQRAAALRQLQQEVRPAYVCRSCVLNTHSDLTTCGSNLEEVARDFLTNEHTQERRKLLSPGKLGDDDPSAPRSQASWVRRMKIGRMVEPFSFASVPADPGKLGQPHEVWQRD